LQRWESSGWILNKFGGSSDVQDPPHGATAAAATTASLSPTRTTNTSTSPNTSPIPSSQEFIRKRNADYAPRKHSRRKIEVEVLNKQKHNLERQKTRLQIEGCRLKRLLRKARDDVDRLHNSG
jgi:hypothetical protein